VPVSDKGSIPHPSLLGFVKVGYAMPTLAETLEEMRPIIKHCISKGLSKTDTLNAASIVIPSEIQGEYRRQATKAAEKLYEEMIHSP
jgi:hypothetical protein